MSQCKSELYAMLRVFRESVQTVFFLNFFKVMSINWMMSFI